MRTLLLALGAVAVAEEKRISREIIRDALPLVLARSNFAAAEAEWQDLGDLPQMPVAFL